MRHASEGYSLTIAPWGMVLYVEGGNLKLSIPYTQGFKFYLKKSSF